MSETAANSSLRHPDSESTSGTRAKADPDSAATGPEEGRLAVLVVEDSQVVRQRLESMIRDLPERPRLCMAASGAEARLLFAHMKPDAVLLDLSLPDEKGFDLLADFKAERSDCRIIVLTNFAYPEFRDHARELGADGFFNKAIEFESAVALLGQRQEQAPESGKERD